MIQVGQCTRTPVSPILATSVTRPAPSAVGMLGAAGPAVGITVDTEPSPVECDPDRIALHSSSSTTPATPNSPPPTLSTRAGRGKRGKRSKSKWTPLKIDYRVAETTTETPASGSDYHLNEVDPQEDESSSGDGYDDYGVVGMGSASHRSNRGAAGGGGGDSGRRRVDGKTSCFSSKHVRRQVEIRSR
jgi:hypothetical protein